VIITRYLPAAQQTLQDQRVGISPRHLVTNTVTREPFPRPRRRSASVAVYPSPAQPLRTTTVSMKVCCANAQPVPEGPRFALLYWAGTWAETV